MKIFKMLKKRCKDYTIWLLFILFIDLFFILFLWLMDANAFLAISILSISISLLLFAAALVYICIKEDIRERVILDFLENPDSIHEIDACRHLSYREQNQIHEIAKILRANMKCCKDQKMQLNDYEEYIELWTHEIKTPLSLMTLMLDNRKDEISPLVYNRMEYARNQTQGYVDQILYYARLKAIHKNYQFEKIKLSECCLDQLSELQIFFKEHNFNIKYDVPEILVVTDKKSFNFMLSQVLHNAVKYRNPNCVHPELQLTCEVNENNNKILFSIKDNGIGVVSYDLPFLFDKGFSNTNDEYHKKTTGMGLYLVKQLADDLNIGLAINSESMKGFEFIFQFPLV